MIQHKFLKDFIDKTTAASLMKNGADMKLSNLGVSYDYVLLETLLKKTDKFLGVVSAMRKSTFPSRKL